jgi:hypothetical protein
MFGIGVKPKKAPKIASLLPRRTWKINPLTRVKPSDKVYSHPKARRAADEEI